MAKAEEIVEEIAQGFDKAEAAADGPDVAGRMVEILSEPTERDPQIWKRAGVGPGAMTRPFSDLSNLSPVNQPPDVITAMRYMWAAAIVQATMELITRPVLLAVAQASQSTLNVAKGASKGELKKAATEGQVKARATELREARLGAKNDGAK